ncbi:DNA-binding FadR family transcriptional regulator [Sphingobium sp. OAS761]|uniref:FadR/GntR family transcriptional regulator n=1 Tax=Sphingobium sp. OAS761 TaxID=2817901 RepID=UPI00209EAA3B|nr:FadR/GntR family transcriptional regulator [Sphingobium sp. OAS761]MCP1469252.1 DNA-binding FadR family transcriptional regulator [Sphingobium sp. OAS761]
MEDLTASKGAHSAPGDKRLRIHGSVAHDLGVAIVSGRYSPGELLLGEIEASERLKISRTAYREALRILSAKGLVESRPKTGTKVSPRAKWHMLDPDVLQWIFELEPSARLLESLFELRRVVEPEAAALAAMRRTDEQVFRMERALKAMKEHTLATDAGRQADQDFHAALLDASGNPFLITLTSGVGAAVAWTTVFKLRHAPLRRDAIPDHRRVFDAVAAGDDGAARAAMTDLVNLALQDITPLAEPDAQRRKVTFSRD